MRQLAVRELHLAQREPYSVQSVIGEPARLHERGAGGRERVPGSRRGVSFPVLHGVQQMREPPEEPAGLGERLGVARPPGQDGRVREGGGGRGLGGLRDGQKRRPGTGERLDADLPVDGVDEYGGVEAHVGSGTGPGAPPARGDPAGGERHRPARQQPVLVRHVVAHLGRGQHQRDGGGEAGSLTLGDGRGPHPAQRARPRRTPPPGGALDLSLRQNRYQQPVVIGDNPSELSVVSAQRETESAKMRHPLCFEPLTEAVAAGPHDSEHDTPPCLV